MTKNYSSNPPYIKADSDMVLCDGTSMTGLGGSVYSKNTDYLDSWQEMTEAEAEALIADTEATEADYQAALADMGVDLNEEK